MCKGWNRFVTLLAVLKVYQQNRAKKTMMETKTKIKQYS